MRSMKVLSLIHISGKKIGAYYGCLLLRPGKIMAFDDPENPTIMEDFIRALGAEPVIYPYRNECCGGYISLKEKDMSQNMCQKIEDSAKGFGADMLITACPLCKYNLNKNASSAVSYTHLLCIPDLSRHTHNCRNGMKLWQSGI